MIKLFKLKHKGDTIVEVLFAMTIISMVLAGGYASSRHSSQALRTAQERGEALKIGESQAEQLKVAVNTRTTLPPAFCFDSGGHPQATPNPAACTVTAVNFNIDISSTPPDYIIGVSWPGLSGITNKVELDYRVQP